MSAWLCCVLQCVKVQAASSKVISDTKLVTQQVREISSCMCSCFQSMVTPAMHGDKHGDTSIATRVQLHALLVGAKPSASNLDCCRVSLTAGDVIEWMYGLWNLILQQVCIAPFERAKQYLNSHCFQARSYQQIVCKSRILLVRPVDKDKIRDRGSCMLQAGVVSALT